MEKLGLIALRAPRATLLVILLSIPLFVYGISKIHFSSDIREIFRSSSSGFALLEEANKEYPEIERDLLVVVEGDKLFTPDALSKMRDLHLELSFGEQVKYVLSMFSAREAPTAAGGSVPVIPEDIASADLEALGKELRRHPLVDGKLLSEDGKLALYVIAFKNEREDITALRQNLADIRHTMDTILEGTGLTYTFTGVSALRVEIIGSLIRDQSRFSLAGLLIGLAICWIFFRRFRFVLIAGAPAAIGALWLLGGMGLAGQDVTVLTNVIPMLVMVLVYADALHMLFGIRRNLLARMKLEKAIEQAVHEIGPACVLTSVTTTLALLSLTLVRHSFIVDFGLTAAFGTALAYVATMTLIPALCAIFLKGLTREQIGTRENHGPSKLLGNISDGAADLVSRQAPAIAAIGVIVSCVAIFLYASNEPHYRYLENLPEDNAAFTSIKHIDKKLAGANTLEVLIRFPKGQQVEDARSLALVGQVHDTLELEPWLRAISSLRSVQGWLAQGGYSQEQMFEFLHKAKSQLATRFYSDEYNSALVTGNFVDLDASELVPLIDQLERKLEVLREANPGVDMHVTGIVPLSAQASYEMIYQLNLSLLTAIASIIVLIALAMRSWRAGLVSILPNILPIAVAGSWLYLSGRGLQFTSVVGFTIGFGIAVDSTIHVLNAIRVERARTKSSSAVLEKAIHNVGPALIVSTLVLVAGVSATIISELPIVQLYGKIVALVLFTGLITAMLFLPSLVALTGTALKRWSAMRDEPDGSPRKA